MTEEQLNILFHSAKEAPLETSTKDVNKWIVAALVPLGFSAVMMKYFKFLLTKKGIIMTFSAIATIGIGATALYLSFGGTTPTSNYHNIKDTTTHEISPEVVIIDETPLATTNEAHEKVSSSPEVTEELPLLPIQTETTPEASIQPISSTNKLKSITINKLVLTTAVDVELIQGTAENIEIKVIKGSKDMIDLVNRGGALNISMNKKANNKDVDIKIRVTVVNLEEIKMEGATQLTSSNTIKSDNLKLDISGASDVELTVECDEILIESEGAAEVELNGSTTNLEIINSGAATIKAFDLKSENSTVENSGAGTVKVNASNSLKMDCSGASTTYYKSDSQNISIKESGVPTIKKL